MFVDTSAIVAILASQPEAGRLAHRLEGATERRITASHVIFEAAASLSAMLRFSPSIADELVSRLIHEARIEVVPITEEVAHLAVRAFERYGKGRSHRAQLNLGQCLSYACAEAHGMPILSKGEDFALTEAETA
jgi:ribonuclease VapC